MLDIKKHVIDIIGNSTLKKWEKELVSILKPSIKIIENESSEFTVGSSKMGGEPDFPKEWNWPEYEKKPLEFQLQLNLKELAPFDIQNLLPSSGWLYFFALFEESGQVDYGLTLYYDGEISSLALKRGPTAPLIQKKLNFELFYMLPAGGSNINELDEEVDEMDFRTGIDHYAELQRAIGQFTKNYDHYSHILGYLDHLNYEPTEKEVVLIQLDFLSLTEKEYADTGFLAYLIDFQELQQKQFANVKVLWEIM